MAQRSILIAIAMVALAATAHGQKTWDNGGGDGSWFTAANWNPDGVPTSTDDVVLDNTSLAGPYSVTMAGATGGTCRTLKVGYSGSSTAISLVISGSASVQLTIAGDGTTADDFILDQQGSFNNQSTAASGNVVDNLAAGNTTRVRSGGSITHNTARSFGTPFPASGNGAITFDSGSAITFAANAPTAIPLSGRTYNTLSLSGSSKTYTATGSGAAVINGALNIGSTCTFNTTMTGPLTFRANINSNGSGGSLGCTAAGGVTIDGGIALAGSGTALTFPNGFTVNATRSLTLSKPVTIPVSQSAEINGTLNVNAAGPVTVLGTLNINSGGAITLAGTISGTGTFNLGSGATAQINNAGGIAATGATGAVQTATRNFSTGASYGFSFVGPSVTGTGLPSTVASLGALGGTDVTLSSSCSSPSISTGLTGVLRVPSGVTLTATFNANPSGTLEIQSGGALRVIGGTVGGSGQFIGRTGATIETDNSAGFATTGSVGAIRTTTRTFETGLNHIYEYNAAGSADTTTGNAIGLNPASITIRNSAALPGGGRLLSTSTTTQAVSVEGGNFIVKSSNTLGVTTGGSVAVSPGATLTIGGTPSGGTLDSLVPVTGGGSFVLASTGTLNIRHPDGITASGASGSIQVAGTRSFSTGASYRYVTTGTGVTGDGLPGTSAVLFVADGADITMSASHTTADYSVQGPSGVLRTGANMLDLTGSTATGGTLEVENGGTLDMNGNVLNGGGTLHVANGGVVRTSHPLGIQSTGVTGALQTSTRTLDAGSSYIFSYANPASSEATTGDGLPSQIGQLVISNAASAPFNVTNVDSDIEAAGLAAVNGITRVPAGRSLLLTGSGTISGTSTLDVVSGATMAIGESPITGGGSVAIGGGAQFIIGHLDGIWSSAAAGAVQTSSRSFSPTASYEYAYDGAGPGAQQTGDGLPSNASSVVIANASLGTRTTQLSAALTPGTLTLASIPGNTLDTNGHDLDLSSATALIGAGAALSVAADSLLTVNTPVTGAGSLVGNANSSLRVFHPEGISASSSSGAIQTGTRTYGFADYTYSYREPQVAPQSVGDGLPASVQNLVIDNEATTPNDRTVLVGATTVTNFLSLEDGVLATGGSSLLVPDNPGLVVGDGYVEGALTRVVDAGVPGVRRFPLIAGTVTPMVDVDPGSTTGSGTITIGTTAGDHPSLPVAAGIALDRFWTVSQTGLTVNDATIDFFYSDSELGGADENQFSASAFDSGVWTTYTRPSGTIMDTGTNRARVVGVDAFSDWTLWQTPLADVADWSHY